MPSISFLKYKMDGFPKSGHIIIANYYVCIRQIFGENLICKQPCDSRLAEFNIGEPVTLYRRKLAALNFLAHFSISQIKFYANFSSYTLNMVIFYASCSIGIT